MVVTDYKTCRKRSGFIVSALLHGGVFCAIILDPVPNHADRPGQPNRKYSVLVLRLEDFRPQRAPGGERQPGAGTGAAAAASKTLTAANRSPLQDPYPPADPGLEGANSAPEHRHRTFELPPVPHRQPIKQTLVQFDVPPEMQLRLDIPLPTAVLWEKLPPVRRKFVAPVDRPQPVPVAQMPSAPELSPPNKELTTAELKIASVIANQNARLVRPPAKTSPLKGAGTQPVTDPPQIAASTPADAGLAALISLPDTSVVSAQTVAIPPANQVAAVGSGRPGSGGTGSSGSGSANSSANRGAGTGASAGSRGLAAGGPASGSGPGPRGASGQGTGLAGPGTGGDWNARPDLPIPGATRLTLPKDGEFPVVVSGSSAAAPYAESVGALSGKMVYSVFISVGLRKKWVLQYCLPKAEEQKNPIKGRAQPVEAPWPYVIERPDNLGSSNLDYVMVHGILTLDGRFDQLALVFPVELDRKDLLMSSLKRWTFRPASRDGVPSEIEILLIIPNQSE